jgi:peptide chain release factor 1
MDELPDLLPFQRRLDELGAQMAEPSFYGNPRRAADVTREHQKLTQLVADHQHHGRLERELAEADTMAKDPSADAAMRELAAAELPELRRRRAALREAVLLAMIPPEPTDSRNTVMEIRAGTGGDEASLFAAELFRLYSKYSDARGWKIAPMSSSASERGGFKEVVFLITGTDVYRQLKFESGVHRVQRVPVTEANGRIHTSTVTVAVLPEAEEVDVKIDPQDLEITVQRASGPGGQGVNTTDSAVRIIHKPTGLIVFCADGRSQQKNKASAMAVLRSRLLQAREDEERAKYAATRRSQIGSGDRSERIRTYNFPQNRLTDHRIGLTLYNLPQVMEGDIEAIVSALQKADYEEKLAALTGQTFMPARAVADEDEMLTVLEIIKKTTDFFTAKGIESARLNAELLIGHALGLKRMQLYLQFERPLAEAELEKIRPLVRRRGLREPLQYITGETEFHGLKLKVDRRR